MYAAWVASPPGEVYGVKLSDPRGGDAPRPSSLDQDMSYVLQVCFNTYCMTSGPDCV